MCLFVDPEAQKLVFLSCLNSNYDENIYFLGLGCEELKNYNINGDKILECLCDESVCNLASAGLLYNSHNFTIICLMISWTIYINVPI